MDKISTWYPVSAAFVKIIVYPNGFVEQVGDVWSTWIKPVPWNTLDYDAKRSWDWGSRHIHGLNYHDCYNYGMEYEEFQKVVDFYVNSWSNLFLAKGKNAEERILNDLGIAGAEISKSRWRFLLESRKVRERLKVFDITPNVPKFPPGYTHDPLVELRFFLYHLGANLWNYQPLPYDTVSFEHWDPNRVQDMDMTIWERVVLVRV